MKTHFVILSALLATFVAPVAAADPCVGDVCPPQETCVGDFSVAVACQYDFTDQRFSSHGVFVYDATTGSFAAAGTNEGYGFFGYTRGADVFVMAPPAGQYFVVVFAQNDEFETDGNYEYGGLVIATWSDYGVPGAEAWLTYTDADEDGVPDADGFEHGAAVLA